MKTINRLLYLLLIIMPIVGCSKNEKPDNFDYGRVENGTYLNDYFNLKIDLPPNWVVQSRRQTEDLANKGKDLVAGDDKKMKALIKASEINTAYLLSVFQYEVGTAVEYNPNIMVVAENIKNSPGIKKGSDYLFQTRRLMQQGQFKYDYVSEEFEHEVIGDIEFYKMDAKMNYLGLEIYQVYYSAILKDFSFSLIISYISDEQKEILVNSINSIALRD